AKSEHTSDIQTIFRNYGGGVKTNRDEWAYDFNKSRLIAKVKRFMDTYNGELDRWRRLGNPATTVDDFVIYDDTKIKWSRDLKLDLQRNHYATFSDSKLRQCIYRPFCKRWLFFDRVLNEEVYQFPQIFPTFASEEENTVICATSVGADHQTFLVAKNIVDIKFGINGN